jgi:low temperature requirement protein LtrA
VSAEAPAAPRRIGPLGGLLRDRSGEQRVTNIELFFDLVYAFAITQLSGYLLGAATVGGAVRTVILLAMVWMAWMYTSWVTNWLDPERMAVRLLLVLLMLVSLAMSAALPRAFTVWGIWVGGAYALMQIGRTIFMVVALPPGPLRVNFERILVWCTASGALAVAGGLVGGHARELLWLLAVLVLDVLGGIVGFATPWLGRSHTADWTIEGSHIAERCQAFILIALGESIVIIGATLSAENHASATTVAAFVVAFAGSVALWWLYFDRAAAASTAVIVSSADPGRLGRTAYHLIHPVMVAGIIVAAAGDEKILTHPSSTASAPSAWLILGGPALFVAGHAAFKYVMWRTVPWTRLAGLAVLALLALTVPVLPEIALAACAAVVVAAVAATDRRPHPGNAVLAAGDAVLPG